MDEIKKKIYLFIFVAIILNGFYCVMASNYLLIVWIIITLLVAYFSIYPDEFFLCVNNAKEYINNYRRDHKNTTFITADTKRERYIKKEDI
ncbi:MAG TPA: hypothetical protein EYH22_01810 [Candidatus Nanopusillus sp.]|nr:hypothetical protein [Candidatus Nanopusillus sp.]